MVVLITGASRGIGASLAAYLAGAGHSLILVSRNRRGLEEVASNCRNAGGSGKVIPVPFDLTELDDLSGDFLRQVRENTGTIDALVNNAGRLLRKPFRETGFREARELFETNVLAPAQLVRLLLPLISRSSLKHVVHVTSMGGFQGSSKFSGLSYYSASKAALGNLAECLAEELREEGIRVNALALGAVRTEMLEEAFPGYTVPMSPSDMAGFIGWFVLHGAGYFNGKILPVSVSTP